MSSANFRVIARLDVKDEHLVKGMQYEGLRKLGDPHDFAAALLRGRASTSFCTWTRWPACTAATI